MTGIFGSWLRDEDNYGPESGWRELLAVDDRYGTTIDEYLHTTHVIEGDARLQRYNDNQVNPNVLFDLMIGVMAQRHLAVETQIGAGVMARVLCPSELRGSGPACEAFDGCPDTRWLCIKGQCEYVLTVPRPAIPLRQNHDRGDGTFDAFRMPLLRPGGQHGVYNSQPFRIFDRLIPTRQTTRSDT